MTATNHTEHYELSQFTKDDRPTYTGDYNSDMSKIDAAIYAASQSGGGGMATVEHTADLTGDGTTDSPLGVADTIARTEDIPSLDGYATTESMTQAIAAAIADRLRAGDIKSGNGINIETSGNQVTISYVGDGSAGGDVSALISRIAVLESQVAALTAAATPAATGLTAEQLDSLYSGGYNIVRVGTPTRSMETEESPNE